MTYSNNMPDIHQQYSIRVTHTGAHILIGDESLDYHELASTCECGPCAQYVDGDLILFHRQLQTESPVEWAKEVLSK